MLRTITVLATVLTLVLGLAAVGTQQGFAQTKFTQRNENTMDRDRGRDRDDRYQARQPERNFNSNGIRGVDRDRGRNRAEDRNDRRRDRDDVMRR